MIYCDGERDLFHEDEFLHRKNGTLFRPYIHRKKHHIPEHFADGGYPTDFKDQEAAPGPVAFAPDPVTYTPDPVGYVPDPVSYAPINVAAYHSILSEDEDWQALQQSLAADTQPQKAGIDLHFAGIDWPAPVDIATGDKNADTIKTLYQAQLLLVNNRQQGVIDHDKAVRASDYTFHQAVFQAYLDVAKGQIDRSVLRTQFLTTAASAIGTVYTAILAFSFGLGQPNHALPAVGIAPAVFLGLAIALAAYYLAYITSQTHQLNQKATTSTHQATFMLPVQRLYDERNRLIEWVASTVVKRAYYLHAAVISLAIGVVFLPIPFVTLPGWLIWLAVIVGLLAVAYPIARHFYDAQQPAAAPNTQNRP